MGRQATFRGTTAGFVEGISIMNDFENIDGKDHNNRQIIGVIPARGGSSRIPRKNLATVGGIPLFSHAIKVAKESKLFSRIVVNSDDDEILSVASEYGAETYQRPEAFGSGKVFVIEVLKEMFRSLGLGNNDVVGVLLPTCPLRKASDLRNAYRLFKAKGADKAVVSVASYETPIQLAHFMNRSGQLEAVFARDYQRSTRSTDHRIAYHYNEAIIFNTIGNLMRQHNLIGDAPYPYIMPAERSLLIDYSFQLELVRLMLE